MGLLSEFGWLPVEVAWSASSSLARVAREARLAEVPDKLELRSPSSSSSFSSPISSKKVID